MSAPVSRERIARWRESADGPGNVVMVRRFWDDLLDAAEWGWAEHDRAEALAAELAEPCICDGVTHAAVVEHAHVAAAARAAHAALVADLRALCASPAARPNRAGVPALAVGTLRAVIDRHVGAGS